MQATYDILFNLQAARLLLSGPRTWTQCAWARNAHGFIVPPADYSACCWCLGGAVQAVNPPGGMVVAQAHLYLNTFLKERKSIGVTTFNDFAKNKAEVLAALDACVKQCAQELEPT